VASFVKRTASMAKDIARGGLDCAKQPFTVSQSLDNC
jgi:hypothetical protein